ncbi:hypothetical protein JDV02_010861 [Purpureocillium takamizusanense]|uniref:Uncharacterized protein n=1 Tax=Purpureocillium takamizusanense TaxID=2060973 RepID=A0A9Q8QGG4_9HYPO|nr:uncharacterized protein JDV02_010861 [Purpureocillium takamizusanense]UNI20439.1 hypothetical protein JDV02_010861 [Purpureocillium takamizusanense]
MAPSLFHLLATALVGSLFYVSASLRLEHGAFIDSPNFVHKHPGYSENETKCPRKIMGRLRGTWGPTSTTYTATATHTRHVNCGPCTPARFARLHFGPGPQILYTTTVTATTPYTTTVLACNAGQLPRETAPPTH